MKKILFIFLLLGIMSCRRTEPTGIAVSKSFITLEVDQRDTVSVTLYPPDASRSFAVQGSMSTKTRHLDDYLIIEIHALEIDTTVLSFNTGKNFNISTLCTVAIVPPPLLPLEK